MSVQTSRKARHSCVSVRSCRTVLRRLALGLRWSIASTSKVKVKIKFALEQATKAQRWSRGILYSFFNLGARWGGWLTPRPGRFTPAKDPVPIV